MPPDERWHSRKLVFDQELEHTLQFLSWSARFQEPLPEFVTPMTEVFQLLEILQDQSLRLDQAMVNSDPQELVFSLQQLHQALEQLGLRMQELREWEAGQPRYSEAPYVQELFRLADAVRRGALAPELLAERLNAYEETQGFVRESLRQQGVLSVQDGARVEGAFALQNQGLDLIFGYLEGGDELQLEEGLAAIKQAWDELLGLRQELHRAEQLARSKFCVKCGVVNSSELRRCAACNARLLDNGHFASVSLGFVEGPSRSLTSGNLERIELAVHRMAAQECSLLEFAAEVEWYRGVHSESQKLLERLPPIDPELLDPEPLARLQHAYEISVQGLDRTEQGLQELEWFVQQRHSGDQCPVPLSAMEKIREGLEALKELETIVSSFLET